MYYSVQEGVRDTWRDHVQTITQQFRQHNWLPAAVGLLVVGWIAMIVMGLQQTVFVTPKVPDTTQVGDSGQNLAVTNTSVVTSNDASGSGSVTTGPPATVPAPSPQSNTPVVSPPTSIDTEDMIGGIEAGKPVEKITEPVNPIVIPPVTVPTPEPIIDLEVTVPGTPVTPELPLDVEIPNPLPGIP